MRIDAHPLVVAAALGLLGPAALADDDPQAGLGGIWAREAFGTPAHPAALGDTIEVIPLEERFVLDGPVEQGEWTRMSEECAVQTLRIGEARVTRWFEAMGDSLVVRTEVRGDEGDLSFVENFSRQV